MFLLQNASRNLTLDSEHKCPGKEGWKHFVMLCTKKAEEILNVLILTSYIQ